MRYRPRCEQYSTRQGIFSDLLDLSRPLYTVSKIRTQMNCHSRSDIFAYLVFATIVLSMLVMLIWTLILILQGIKELFWPAGSLRGK
jgi:hypothetical protein